MFDVELEWTICRDGVVAGPVRNPEPMAAALLRPPAFTSGEHAEAWRAAKDAERWVPGFRMKSERREVVTRTLTLKDTVAVHLANVIVPPTRPAKVDPDLWPERNAAAFLSAYGFPSELGEIDKRQMVSWSTTAARLLASATSDPASAMVEIDQHLRAADAVFVPYGAGAEVRRLSLDVTLTPAGDNGRPRVVLRPRSLRQFVLLEAAAIACTEGVGLRTCDYCGTYFLTGPGTERRSTARFCRDLHRVYFAQKRPGGLPQAGAA